MIDGRGATRLVFVFRHFVIKVPRLNYGHTNFLHGCLSNWKEREFYKNFKNIPTTHKDLIIPTLWCSWFGLFQIQRRAEVLSRELTKQEIRKFKKVCTDIKKENFGVYEGKIICIDYGE